MGIQDLADKAASFLAAIRVGLGGRGVELAKAAIQAGMNSTSEQRTKMGNSQMETRVVLGFQVTDPESDTITLQDKISKILR